MSLFENKKSVKGKKSIVIYFSRADENYAVGNIEKGNTEVIAEYIKETDNHVLYRVTPIYEDDNLVASGVQIEAKSVEDNGDGICFNVYCYNVQPGITIDYKTGESEETVG